MSPEKWSLNMNKIINILCGEAKLEVYGDFPELYINALSKLGVPFWKYKKHEKGRASLIIPLSCLNDAEKAKMGIDCDIKAVKKSGLALFLQGMRRRRVLFMGFFMAFITVCVLSLFVWDIEVMGNETVPTSDILAVLRNHGVHIGMYGLSIDQQDLRSRVLYEMKDLSWITVNIVGTKAKVIVREKIKKPQIVDIKKPSIVVAAKSGFITKLNVFQGEPLVSAGQAVLKGDVLVSSEMQSLNSGTRQVHAMGEVYARTWYEFSYQMPLEYNVKKYTGKESKNITIILFGKRINLYFNNGISDTFCDKIIKNDILSFPGGVTMPISLYTEKSRRYELLSEKVDSAEAEKLMKKRLTEKLDKLIGGGEKKSVSFESKEENSVLKITLRAECLEQIGEIVEP